MIIYKAINTINKKAYVGKTTKTIELRRQQHINMSRWNSQLYFHRAIRKHGVVNFDFCILEECKSEKELSDRECFWILKLKSKGACGYNLTDAGDISKCCKGNKLHAGNFEWRYASV